MVHFHSSSIEDILKNLNSSEKGLTSTEAKKRLSEYGFNEIREAKRKPIYILFLEQFNNFLILILLIAALLSVFVGEFKDALLILIIVFFNGVFGFIQEFKSEKAIEALKRLTALNATALRDNKQVKIPAKELVPGDIVIIEEGSKVPADCRLIEVYTLQTQEASLTGESSPINKSISVLKEDAVVADQKNMVFSSTIVTSGKAKAMIVKTGMETEIGKIANLIQKQKEEQTPLQQKLNDLSKKMGVIALFICTFILVMLVLKGDSLLSAFLLAISLAVAAVPEGLPAIVTISLALGVQRMSKRNALIRKLPAVETLGSTNIILSDKTGTLTKNEMTVRKIYCSNKIIEVAGIGYSNKGSFITGKKIPDLEKLLTIGLICNNAFVDFNKKQITGDPTEASLIVSASKYGLDKEKIDSSYKKLDEIPFNPENKYMATINGYNNKKILFVKGAPDIIIDMCSFILIGNKKIRLTDIKKREILEVNNKFGEEALRVLGFAYKENDSKLKDLVFVGLQGMIDPPRETIKEDIKKCSAAGIKVKIVTGDYITTAVAIAKDVGINGKAITGKELGSINESELKKIAEEYDIFARVTPEHKLRIVSALKSLDYVVAVTGDGVNDAPALKKADIGISMNITGTDVSKEASDMILVDDNFHSIVNAIEEGRIVYANIQKFVSYLLSVNIAEILIILIAALSSWPLPLIAVQLLWLNLVTDGFPALALSVDPPEKNIMQNKPRKLKESIITKDLATIIILSNIIVVSTVIYVFTNYLQHDLIKAQTMAFTTLVIIELAMVFFIRKVFDIPILKSNKYLLLAVLSSLMLHILLIYTPLGRFFKTTSLELNDWIFMLAAISIGLVLFLALEKTIKIFFSQEQRINKSLMKFELPK
ncbi:MAG: calcium-translocating P-type ATPase, PMCA-type [Nanoarchaeota archaeon]